MIAGGVVVGLGAVAVGSFLAINSFLGSGSQPAEALPASAVGYLSVDLDPSGAQKIEALQTLRKFPGLEEEFDLEADEDIRKRIFEEALPEECDLNFDDDVDPWLGNRFAVAAINEGSDEPYPVFVIQTSDAGGAEEGLEELIGCGGSGPDDGAFEVNGDWIVVAETQEQVDEVIEATGEGTLADDDDFGRWTSEVGDDGILIGYAAPATGELLADNLDLFGSSFGGDVCAEPQPFDSDESLSEDGFSDFTCEPAPAAEIPDALKDALDSFEGAAFSVRFEDEGLELVTAAGGLDGFVADGLGTDDSAGDIVESLPANTVGAYGLGFGDDWGQQLIDYYSDVLGDTVDIEAEIESIEAELGLSIPEDIEKLLGDRAVVSVSGDLDPQVIANSDDPSDAPIGVKIEGDADEITEVLDKLVDAAEGEADDIVEYSEDGDSVAISPNDDYRADLLDAEGLGDNDVYQDVIREGDAGGILFVNFDEGDWLAELVGDDPTVKENLAPLSGAGVTTIIDDGVAKVTIRVATDKE